MIKSYFENPPLFFVFDQYRPSSASSGMVISIGIAPIPPESISGTLLISYNIIWEEGWIQTPACLPTTLSSS